MARASYNYEGVLGSYIHHRKRQNYYRQGLSVTRDKPASANDIISQAAQSIQQEHENIIAKAKSKTAKGPSQKELNQMGELFYALFMGDQERIQQLSKAEQEMAKKMKEMVDQYLKENFNGLSLDKGNVHKSMDEEAKKRLNELKKKSENAQNVLVQDKLDLDGERGIRISTLKNRLEGIKYLMSSKETYGNYDINKLQIMAKDLEDLIITYGNDNAYLSKEIIAKSGGDVKSAQKIITALNQEITAFSYPTPKAIGMALEYAFACFSAMLEAKTLDNTEEILGLIDKAMVGQNTVITSIDISHMVGGSKRANQGLKRGFSLDRGTELATGLVRMDRDWKIVYDKEGNNYIEYRGNLKQQQKADIEFNFGGYEDPLAVSLKNYSLKNSDQKIKVVDSTSFLYLIQSSQANYQAYNHWLNLGVSLQGGLAKENGIRATKVFHSAIKMVRLKILAGGLTGDIPGRTGAADYFLLVARNGSHKGIYFLPMGEILSEMGSVIEENNANGLVITTKPGWNSTFMLEGEGRSTIYAHRNGSFKNPSRSEGFKNIERMLVFLKSIKVEVELRQTALNSFKNIQNRA